MLYFSAQKHFETGPGKPGYLSNPLQREFVLFYSRNHAYANVRARNAVIATNTNFLTNLPPHASAAPHDLISPIDNTSISPHDLAVHPLAAYTPTGYTPSPATAVPDLAWTPMDSTRSDPSSLSPEHLEILGICTVPLSVAEVAAYLNVPLVVVKVLIGDLIERGDVVAGALFQTTDITDTTFLQAVLDGIRRI